MINYRSLPFYGTLLVVFVGACDTDDQQAVWPQLNTNAGIFEGLLPDGRSIDKTGILVSNDLGGSASSLEGSYVYHSLSLSLVDNESDVNIVLELPYVKFSDDFLALDEASVTQAAREHYAYAVVKDKLSMGDKTILSLQDSDVTNAFRVTVQDQNGFNGFMSDGGMDQTGSYLKVVEVVESTEIDPNRGEVQTLLVTFDADVKLYSIAQTTGDPTHLKGKLTMKYQQK